MCFHILYQVTMNMILWIFLIIIVCVIAWLISNHSKRVVGNAEELISRFLPKERLPYKVAPKKFLRTLHAGQRKLLLTEIEFLTKYGDLADTVLYVGAAPGTHLVVLHELFPKHKFILYDPRPYDKRVLELPNFEFYNEYFTDEAAEKYIGQDLLFITDIRNIQEAENPDKSEGAVFEDMTMQKRWIEMIKPKMSSIKFRLPFTEGKTEYFDGDIYIQPFARLTSTETRLFTDGKSTKTYDNKTYEEQLWYHNNKSRQLAYDNDVVHDGLDNCYDCVTQVQILNEYISKMNKVKFKPNFTLDLKTLLTRIDALLGSTKKMNHGVNKNKKQIKKSIKSRLRFIKSF